MISASSFGSRSLCSSSMISGGPDPTLLGPPTPWILTLRVSPHSSGAIWRRNGEGGAGIASFRRVLQPSNEQQLGLGPSTLRSSEQREYAVSPHVQFRTILWSSGPPLDEAIELMRHAKIQLQPLYDFVLMATRASQQTDQPDEASSAQRPPWVSRSGGVAARCRVSS